MIFPSNNLPTSSQPWAREITKQLSNIIDSDNSNQINNTARDNQLNSSIIALSSVVSDVTNALQEIGLLQDTVLVDGDPTKIDGANIKVGTLSASQITTGTLNANLVTVTNINADNIESGTITGVTFQTAASGTRTVLTGTHAEFYFQGNYVGDIIGDDTWSGLNSIAMRNASSTHGFYTDATTAGIHSPSAYIAVGNAATVSGNGSSADFGGLFPGTAYFSGEIRATGGITSTDFMQSENYAGGGVTGASINNNGTIIRTSSSARYKQDIEDLVINYNDVLLLQPKRFKFKDEAAASSNARYYAGFIAEEVDKTSLKDFVAYQTNEDGSRIPDGVYYGELTTALLEAIKHQDSLIKSLTTRIETLENGA